MPAAIAFDEEMEGFVALGATNPQVGYEKARDAKSRLGVALHIAVADLDAFIADEKHTARVTG